MAKKFLTDINIAAGVYDSSGDIGNSGQVLSSTGSGVNWINATSSASIIYQDGFTGDGSTTAFTLANSLDNENKTQVYIEGVYQHKDNYSLSGTTLTFSSAPPNTSDIEVISFSSVSAADDILYDDDFTSAGLMTTDGSGVYSITTNNSSNWNTAYTHSQAAHAPANAEQNVQSDWTATSGDSFIQNKPATFTPSQHTQLWSTITSTPTTLAGYGITDTIPSGNQIIDWTTDQGSTEIHSGNYINTTYTVGDGGLTQNNFTNALKTKLDGIETSADVTDATNVTAAGALMDSELTDLAGVKGVTISDLATVSYVDTEVAGIVDSAPGTLDTLNELAAALGDDANFSTTVTNSIATKLPLAGGTLTGDLTLDDGAGASPSIIFKNASDETWSIFNGSQGVFNIREGTTDRLEFAAGGDATFTGNVGVAGKTPAYGLSLAQGSAAGNKIVWTDVTPTFAASIYANNTNDKLTFATKNPSGTETTALEIDTSQNATFAGDARFNQRVRIGDVTGLSNRGAVRIDTRGDAPADLLFGRDTAGTATGWAGVYWALSSRNSGQGNKFTIYRGSSHDSPYNSEAIPFQIEPNLNATFAGNITFGDSHFIGDDGDDNLLIQSSANENVIIHSADDIILDVDTSSYIRLKDNGTEFGKISHNSNNLRIFSSISDGDILLQGNDGGSTITALQLDMSNGGSATFRDDIDFGGKITQTGTGTNNFAGSVTAASLTISGSSNGLYFTGGNNRMYFNNHRALEGATDGSILQIGEGYSTIRIEDTTLIKYLTSANSSTFLTLHNDVGADLNTQKTFIDFIFEDDNDNDWPQVRIGAEVGQNSDANSTTKEGSGAFVVYTNNATTNNPGNPSNLIEKFRVDYQGHTTATGSLRAPIFYDSSNTGYYTYPSNQSVFYRLKLQGTGTANAATLEIDNPSSSAFIHSGELFTTNMTAGQANIFVIGKEGSTKNAGYIGYNYASAGSNNNYVTIGHWSADHLFRVYGDVITSTVGIRSDADVRGTIFYDSNDTNYQINPAATSRLNIVNHGTLTWQSGSNNPTAKINVEVADGAAINIYNTQEDKAYLRWIDSQSNGAQFCHLSFDSGNNYFTINNMGSDTMFINAAGYSKLTNNGNTTWNGYNFHSITNSATNEPTVMVYSHASTGNVYGVNVIHRSTSSNTSGRFFLGSTNSGANDKIKIYSNGNIQNLNNSYGQLSDINLKENIVDATSKLDEINQVRIVNFNYIDDVDEETGIPNKQIGVVAQELEQIFPGLVYECGDTEVPTKAVKYSVFVPMLIKAVQELTQEVQTLKDQINGIN